MSLLIKPLFIILPIIFLISFAGAETLTLKQAINIALKDNHALKAFSWAIEAQENDVNMNKGNLYPKVSLEEKFLRTNNPTYGFMAKLNQERFAQEDFIINRLNNPGDISDFQTSLVFEQPLYVPKVYIGLNMSRKELKAKNVEYQRKKDAVVLNVVKTFFMVQTVEEYLMTAQKSVDDALEHKRLAALRNKAGTGLYSDVLRAEVAVKNAEALVVKAKGDLEVTRRALGLNLGRTEAVEVSVDRVPLPVSDLSSYLDVSIKREDLKALTLRYENSREAVNIEKSAFIPEIGIRGSYQMNDHNSPFSTEGESYLLMGFLKWNLFDSSARHKIKKAEAKTREMEEHLSGLENKINYQVNNAYARLKEKEQNLSLSKAVLMEAEEALRLVSIRYENSLSPMVDLLDTQLMLSNARAGLVMAESDYVNAIVELYYQSGVLLETLSMVN